jgi:hypothetical protein
MVEDPQSLQSTEPTQETTEKTELKEEPKAIKHSYGFQEGDF